MPRPKSHNQSKIGTIYYNYKGVWEEANEETEERPKETIKDKKVKVDILMHKRTDDTACHTPPYPVGELWFELRTPNELNEKGEKYSVVGPDIEILRKALWGILDKRFAIKWERYYLVQIQIGGSWRGSGTSVDYSYKDINKGTAHDGTLVMQEHEYNRGMIIKPWPGEFKDKGGRVLACIPATEINQTGLETFDQRFRQLGEEMKKMLRPKLIQKTLEALSSTKLLPLPTEPTEPEN